MVSNLSKNPVVKTPEKVKGSSVENTSISSLSSPTAQFFSKESSDNIDLPNSGSKTLNSVQLFGKNEYHQNNQTGSRVLNSSPSFPPVQRKGSTDLSPKTAAASNKTGLPDNVKSGVEQLSGVSLSDVKVHYNSPKPAQLHAHAYAQGTDIHVTSGQEKHVPHEAWHVVQQKQGRVQATKQMKGEVPVNDDAGLENEADVMGAKAVQMKFVESDSLNISKSENASNHNTPAQLAPKEGGHSDGYGEKDSTFSQYNPMLLGKADKNSFNELDVYSSGGNSPFSQSNPMLLGRAEVDVSSIGILDITTLPTLYHTTAREGTSQSILSKIDPSFFNESSRFGGGFYLTSDIKTSILELEHHQSLAYETIIYSYNGAKIADCTSAALQKIVKDKPLHLRAEVEKRGFSGVAFKSQRGDGTNVVIFKNFDSILTKGEELMRRRRDDDGKLKEVDM